MANWINYDLRPMYDSRKSFYGKAVVMDYGDRKSLYSYETFVCEVKDGKYEIHNVFAFSPTTCRHIREFLQQNGFPYMTKQEIIDNATMI